MNRPAAALACSVLALLVACMPRAPVRPDAAQRPVEHAVESAHDGVRGTSFAEAQASGRAELVMLFVPAVGFASMDNDGRPDGVTIQLLRDFADWVSREYTLQVEVRWVVQPQWRTFYAQVRDAQGGVFGVGNVTITEGRRAEIDFSPPYMRNVAVLVTHARQPELTAMDEIDTQFAGLGALVFPGTLHEARITAIAAQHSLDLQVESVASNDELIQHLSSSGQWFSWIDAYNFWRARQQGLPLRRHPVGDDGSEAFGVILPRGSDWTPVIESFFHANGGYVASPRFRDHLVRHLGAGLAAMISGERED
jgi:ABC-type amino acid transport substrate-binding protein